VTKKILPSLVGATVILATVGAVHAQKPATIPRIGILRAGSPPDATLNLFLQGLRELGYTDGQNVQIEIRYAEGKPARSAELAMELVGLKVDGAFYLGDANYSQSEAGDEIHPHRHGQHKRSGWNSHGRQSRSTRWQHHWHVSARLGPVAQTVGVAQGNFSKALKSGHVLE
jgi:hypothetical protein